MVATLTPNVITILSLRKTKERREKQNKMLLPTNGKTPNQKQQSIQFVGSDCFYKRILLFVCFLHLCASVLKFSLHARLLFFSMFLLFCLFAKFGSHSKSLFCDGKILRVKTTRLRMPVESI